MGGVLARRMGPLARPMPGSNRADDRDADIAHADDLAAAEELLRNTSKYTSSLYQNARARLETALVAATAELAKFEEEQVTRMMDATLAANARYRDQTGEARVLRAFD